jgi:outer membrane cobalamin receptor
MNPVVMAAVLTAAFVACPSHVAAQSPGTQAAPADLLRFNADIVVTPERGDTPRALVPASTVVLDSAALQALPAVHLSEIVSFVPGFNVGRAAFHAGRPVVSARGFFGGGEAEYILLLVDGVPVADVESGLIDWSVVPTASIRRIEASRGPGAALYGDSAVGGVIQILTDRAASGGQLTTTGGSFGTFSADGVYGRHGPDAGFNLSAAARRSDGAFEHSGGRQVVVNGNADGRSRGFTWRWTASGDGRERDDPGVLSRTALRRDAGQSDPLYRFDALDRRSVSTAFTLRHGLSVGRPQARVYLSVRDEDLIRTILLAPGLGDRRARSLSTAAVGGSVEGEHAFAAARPAIVRFGVDLSREHLETSYRDVTGEGTPGTLNSDIAGHRARAGMFVSASWDPASRVRVSSAVRWDNVDDGGFSAEAGASPQRAWSPRAGVVVQLNEAGTVSLFSQVSRAFKVPTLDQRFDPRPYPDFRGGSFTISNIELVPQRAVNVEAGVSGTGRVRWSALAYRMAVEDEIDFDLRTFRYANIGESRHVGVELEAEGQWWDRLRPSVSYALSRVVDVDDDRQLKNIPRHRIGLGIAAELPWAVGLLARYYHSGGGYLDDENAYAIAGPSALDLRIRRPVGRHAFFLDLLNLTDDVYEEYGFTLTDFTGRVVPYAYPSAPRAVRAGLTLSF